MTAKRVKRRRGRPDAALSAVRCCQELKAYYEQKIAEGKSKLLVLNNASDKSIYRILPASNTAAIMKRLCPYLA